MTLPILFLSATLVGADLPPTVPALTPAQRATLLEAKLPVLSRVNRILQIRLQLSEEIQALQTEQDALAKLITITESGYPGCKIQDDLTLKCPPAPAPTTPTTTPKSTKKD